MVTKQELLLRTLQQRAIARTQRGATTTTPSTQVTQQTIQETKQLTPEEIVVQEQKKIDEEINKIEFQKDSIIQRAKMSGKDKSDISDKLNSMDQKIKQLQERKFGILDRFQQQGIIQSAESAIQQAYEKASYIEEKAEYVSQYKSTVQRQVEKMKSEGYEPVYKSGVLTGFSKTIPIQEQYKEIKPTDLIPRGNVLTGEIYEQAKVKPEDILQETKQGGYLPVYKYSQQPVDVKQPSFLLSISGYVQEKNQYFSKYIPTLEEIREQGISKIKDNPKLMKIYEDLEKKAQKEREESRIKQVYYDVGTGLYKEIQEKPFSTVVKTGTFATLPLFTGGGSKVLSYIPSTTARTLIGGTFKYGLPLVYAGSVIERTKEGEAEEFGRILGGEVLPFFVGTKIAYPTISEGYSLFKSSPIWSEKGGMAGGRQKQVQKQISKNRFEKLKEFFNKVERDVANKEGVKEQYKYLDDLAQKIDKTDKTQVENFKKMMEHLYEVGILKPIEFQKSSEVIVYVKEPLLKDSLKVIGLTTASLLSTSPLFSAQPSQPSKEEQEISKEISTSKYNLSFFQPVKSKEKQQQIPKTFPLFKTQQQVKQVETIKSIQNVLTTQATKTSQIERQALKTQQLLQQRQLLRQQQIQKQIMRPKLKVSGYSYPLFLFHIHQTPALSKVKDKDKDLFQIFTKKKGQDILIGKAKTLKEAQEILKMDLDETLSASGYISFAGKRIATLSLFGKQFRPAKADFTRVVERRSFRLSKKSEVLGIQKAKKSKQRTKKSKRFNWFS